MPVLLDSLSVFECARHAIHDGGDHFILVGEVKKATFEPGLDPLLYFRGQLPPAPFRLIGQLIWVIHRCVTLRGKSGQPSRHGGPGEK